MMANPEEMNNSSINTEVEVEDTSLDNLPFDEVCSIMSRKSEEEIDKFVKRMTRLLDAYEEKNEGNVGKYVNSEMPLKLKRLPFLSDKTLPPYGINLIEWSYDSNLIASVDESIPNVVWIWDANQLCLKAVLIQSTSIKCICWNPTKPQLILCTVGLKLYFWSHDGAFICDIPYESKDFQPSQINWSPNGDSLIVKDKVFD